MSLIVLLPGTPLAKQIKADGQTITLPTLAQGDCLFKLGELVNNLNTTQAISAKLETPIFTYSFSNRKNPYLLIKAGISLRKLIKAKAANGVYVFWGGPSAWIATIFSPVPVVVALLGSDLQGSYNHLGQKTMFGKMLAYFSHLAANKAAAVVVMSQKMKGLLSTTNQQKTFVLPEGVDLEKFKPLDKIACRILLGWPSDLLTVIFFDSGAFVKNAPLAKAAFKCVQQKIPQATLICIKGIPHQELITYYNAADLLLVTSYHEGSNNSIKEALACNCPIVATDAGDAAERLKEVEQSYCVPGMDAEKLAEKMIRILEKPTKTNGRVIVQKVSVNLVAIELANLLSLITKNDY